MPVLDKDTDQRLTPRQRLGHRRTYRPQRSMINRGIGVITHGTGVIDHALSHQRTHR
jgi:hypothetical protein